MFIGQQFLQNVLDYSTLSPGWRSCRRRADGVVAPRSAKLVEARGARFTLLIGYAFCVLGFLTMLLLWKDGIPYWKVGLGYAFRHRGRLRRDPGLALADRLGAGHPRRDGVGHRRPAARPRRRHMQSIFGALLTAGYAAAAERRDRSSPRAPRSPKTSKAS